MSFHECYKSMATGPLGFPMLDSEARELDKQLDTGEFFKFRKFSSNNEANNPKERTDISIVSDESIDADGEIVEQKSIDWGRHKKNPVVAFNHNYSIPPVGKCLWTKLIGGNVTKAKTQYLSRPEHIEKDKWFPDTLFHMIKEGFLPGKSIGGVSKKREPTKNDPESWQKATSILYNTRIYEYSVCPLQNNSNALTESVGKGLYIPDEILSTDFPEVYESLKNIREQQKEYNDSFPVIKSFRTVEQFHKEEQQELVTGLASILKSIPEQVNDAFEVMCGRV